MGTDGPGGADTSYAAAEIFFLRAPTLPVNTVTDVLESCRLTGSSESPGWQSVYTESVLRLCRSPLVLAAIKVASPDLARALESYSELPAKKQLRAVLGLGRYLNRMSIRPTPFGRFAGVTTGGFGDELHGTIQPPGSASPRARLDLAWLLTLLAASAVADQRRDSLPVRVNDLVHEGRGRLWLPSMDPYGLGGSTRTASVALTRAVRAVIRRARSPVPAGILTAHLAAEFPGWSRAQAADVIERLLGLGVLVIACQPRLHGPDDHARPADLFPGLGDVELPAALDQIAADVAEFNRCATVATTVDAQDRIERQARMLTPGYRGSVVQVDVPVEVSGPLTLPREVQRIAEQAASLLITVTAADQYSWHLAEYAAAFTERYGSDAEIPVLEVLTAGTGLGPPSGYLNPRRALDLPSRSAAPGGPSTRDAVLHGLIASALTRRVLDVELGEQAISELASATRAGTGRPAPPSLDVHLQLIPPDAEQRRWRGVVSGTGVCFGGRSVARVYHLLAEEGKSLLRGLARADEERMAGRTVVELTYLPTAARALNVSVRPLVRQWELPVNVHPALPPDRVLHARQVLVGVRGGRFYLHSMETDTELVFTQQNLVSSSLAPNVCRFLLEVSASLYRPAATFQWGALEQLEPFLPRITCHDVVLRRASWRLRVADMPDSEGSLESFQSRLWEWASLWMMPRVVYLMEGDNYLLLDLDSAPSLYELRLALSRSPGGSLRLEEALPVPTGHGLKDSHDHSYAVEIVVPVIRKDTGPDRPGRARAHRHSGAVAQRAKHIGSDWLSIRLHAEAEAHDTILVRHLPRLMGWGDDDGDHAAPGAFFVRYNNPGPHLRVRFHVPSQERLQDILGRAVTWSGDLVRTGLISDFDLTTYHREVERYGGPLVIDQAERLFQWDSLAVTKLLGHLIVPADAGRQIRRSTLAVLSVVRIARTLLPSPGEQRHLARRLAGSGAGGPEYRAVPRGFWTFCESSGPTAALLDQVESFWRSPARQFTIELDRLAASRGLYSGRPEIISSLLHMHCNRIGLRSREEQAVYGMWRRLLDASLNYRPSVGRLRAQRTSRPEAE